MIETGTASSRSSCFCSFFERLPMRSSPSNVQNARAAFSVIALASGLNVLLDPSGYSLTPGIYEAECKHNDKEENLNKAKETQLLEDDCPASNKYDVYIKRDEEESKDVEAQRILHHCRANGRLTRLIGLQLFFGSIARRDQVGKPGPNYHEHEPTYQ